MDASYGEGYARLYRMHWWWRAREEFLARALARTIRPGEAGEVLDFGSGDGLFFDVLAHYGMPSGIEPHGEWLDPQGPWRARIDTRPLQPDPSQAGRFGLVVALDVFEHLEDPRPAIAELRRRTRPGGWWLVTVPAFRSLWTTHDDLNQHCRRYRRAELAALLTDAGLDVVESRYLFGWLALAKLLVRAKEGVLRTTPTAPAIPPRPINAALLGLTRAELRLFGSVPVPFGSSVLAIARLSRGAPPSP